MSFANIYGPAKQIDMPNKTMAQQRVPHASLFSGPAAIGHKTLAPAFTNAPIC
jgi:DNA polymerase III gamma/tau subunit